jgi:protein TonB
MYGRDARANRQSRLVAGPLALALQLAIAMLVVFGLSARHSSEDVSTTLTSLDLRLPIEPPPPPPPRREHHHASAGKSAPANIRARATPVVAPVVPALKPPPVPAATHAASGTDATAGAAALPGPGSGAGGEGQGTGSGDSGNGGGDGGTDSQLVSGRIKDSDAPQAMRDAAFEGTTRAELTVGSNGRVSACRISRSSGSRVLDDLTCQLILQRFRFRPERDASGRAIASAETYDHEWSITGQFDDQKDKH